MRQRVAIARTLASEPRILLMDEPFAALDEQTRLLLGDKVLQIQQALKQTTLLITHNLTEAVQLSDRVLVMTYRPGRLKRIVDIDLPHPRDSEVVGSDAFGHYVAADLARPARGSEPRHRGRRVARAARAGHAAMSASAWCARTRSARAARSASATTASLASRSSKLLIRAGVINRFIVPLPSQILAAMPRIVAEENVLHRFWQTTQEVLVGEPAARRGRHRARRAALPLRAAARSPASPGSARSPRRRSCSCIRCSS